MKLDNHGIKIIADFEGLSLKPYYATEKEKEKGIATIGYGNTFYPNGVKVKITDKPITEKKAFEILGVVANDFALRVGSLIHKPVNQHQFNAVVSLAYNIGIGAFSTSTLLRKLNWNPNDEEISYEFSRWNKQAGQVLRGLTKRRQYESKIYFTDETPI